MKLEATVNYNKEPETVTQVSGKVVEFRKKTVDPTEFVKPTANHFGAGLNNLTSYLDD